MRAVFWFALMLARFFVYALLAQWRSRGLIIPWLQVRVLHGAPFFFEKKPSEPFGGDDERRLLREWASMGCVLESIARKAVI